MKTRSKTHKPRLWVDNTLQESSCVILSEEQTHYLSTVLRRRPKDQILLFNGTDGEWTATLSIEKRRFKAQCIHQERTQEKEESVWLGFSPLRQHRQQWLIEKATELGVGRLVPIKMNHSTVSTVNREKMRNQSIEAVEQSERMSLPLIDPLTTLEAWLCSWPPARILYVALERVQEPFLMECLDPGTDAAFLVGPEGGVSQKEADLLKTHPFVRSVSLGNAILRSETAAIVCLTLYQQIKKLS